MKRNQINRIDVAKWHYRRGCITQPRVARGALPWVCAPNKPPTLKGLPQLPDWSILAADQEQHHRKLSFQVPAIAEAVRTRIRRTVCVRLTPVKETNDATLSGLTPQPIAHPG